MTIKDEQEDSLFNSLDTLCREYGLNERQKLFIKHYLSNGFNGTAAAKSAGYKSGGVTAYYLVNNPKVQAVIEKEKKRIFSQLGVKAERVIEEFAKIGLFSMSDVLEVKGKRVKVKPLSQIPPHAMAAIQELVVKANGETSC